MNEYLTQAIKDSRKDLSEYASQLKTKNNCHQQKVEKQNDKDGCGKCIKEKKGCCHDEVKFFKIDDAHSVAVVNDVPSTPIFTIAFNYFYQHDLLSNILENSILENHSPPSLSPPDIFTRNCVFRI